jgi:uncharacterized damage-inducible protein DinB
MNTNLRWITVLACGTVFSLLVVRPVGAPETAATTIATEIDRAISSIEKRLVDAADAMPAEKYGFVPTNGEFKGVNSFGQQIAHVADDNYASASRVVGEKPPADSSTTHITSKAEILTYLRGSFALAHRAAASLTAENIVVPVPSLNGGNPSTRLREVVFEISHAENHYGQIVEYLRMNGIIPPASRPQPK